MTLRDMTLRDIALRYGEFLLHRIRILGHYNGYTDAVSDLCDRFERLMENLPPVPSPLVWEGDYA